MTEPLTAVVPAQAGAVAPALTVIVRGHRPAPQGSKKHIGGGRMIEQSKRVRPWRDAVQAAAAAAVRAAHAKQYGGAPAPEHTQPLDGPLRVEATFTVVKPASAPKRRTTWPTTRHSGDLDKLLRSCFDALTDAGAIADDSRVIEVTARKVFPDQGRHALPAPGAVIRIWTLTEVTP